MQPTHFQYHFLYDQKPEIQSLILSIENGETKIKLLTLKEVSWLGEDEGNDVYDEDYDDEDDKDKQVGERK
jgi:hypothetical protein